MAYKQKSISLVKKNSSNLILKEIFQQNTLTTEIMRSIATRSEDIQQLKSLSEKKTQKLKVQAAYAEKSISEVETKEEIRVLKEEPILVQLVNAKLESSAYKTQFEKIIKKMFKLNSQFDEDPSEVEMSMSEVHVQKIMNMKIGPENTIITYNEKGNQMITVPSASFSVLSWKDTCAQSTKIIDCLLSTEVMSLYPPMHYCIKRSREILLNEIAKLRLCIEEGTSLSIPNFSVIITKKSKNSFHDIKKKVLPLATKSNLLPEPDLFSVLLKMFLELNSEIQKSKKIFKDCYIERNSSGKRTAKSKNLVEKAMRVRNYEKYSAVSPWVNDNSLYPLTTVRAFMSLTKSPQILFDLENPYFEDNKSFANRIRFIHSTIVIQKAFRIYRQKKVLRSVNLIQKHCRAYLAKLRILKKKTENFRKIFHWERLKHWYSLLASKIRENKSKVSDFNYEGNEQNIIRIQKSIRGFLARKIEIKWRKIFLSIRENKREIMYFKKKMDFWKAGLEYEEFAISYSLECEDDRSNYILKKEGHISDEELVEGLALKDNDECESRKKFLAQSKFERIITFE